MRQVATSVGELVVPNGQTRKSTPAAAARPVAGNPCWGTGNDDKIMFEGKILAKVTQQVDSMMEAITNNVKAMMREEI